MTELFTPATGGWLSEELAERFDPTPHAFQEDPVGWVNQHEFTWSKQDAILESVAEHRYTAVPSAHGPGKSWTGARAVCWWLDVHAPGEAFAVTTAPTWNQVHAILLARDPQGQEPPRSGWADNARRTLVHRRRQGGLGGRAAGCLRAQARRLRPGCLPGHPRALRVGGHRRGQRSTTAVVRRR